MLIICDLDDTLVRTCDTFTPHQLKKAVLAMANAGLHLEDHEEAVRHICQLDKAQPSARSTIRAFLEHHSAGERFFEIGCKEVYKNFSLTHSIEPMPGVNHLLKVLSKMHLLVIVTAGVQHQQLWKLESAGIDSALFSKIMVCEKGQKLFFYQQLLEEFNVGSSEAVVIGDRIASDLTPGRKLGMMTVQIRQGRGTVEPRSHPDVDVVVHELSELMDVIERASCKIMTKSILAADANSHSIDSKGLASSAKNR